jgi:diadenosine tetraphosphate (Ap4A) HIT family hydrolase
VLDTQVFYSGEKTAALINYQPAIPGHTMIIPKRHVERIEDLTPEEMAEIGQTIQKVDRAIKKIYGNTGSLILQKNGKEAGQSVPHVHFHYYPRNESDGQAWFIYRILKASWEAPMRLEEQIETVAKCKAALHE